MKIMKIVDVAHETGKTQHKLGQQHFFNPMTNVDLYVLKGHLDKFILHLDGDQCKQDFNISSPHNGRGMKMIKDKEFWRGQR